MFVSHFLSARLRLLDILLEHDCYPKWLKSEEYKKYMKGTSERVEQTSPTTTTDDKQTLVTQLIASCKSIVNLLNVAQQENEADVQVSHMVSYDK